MAGALAACVTLGGTFAIGQTQPAAPAGPPDGPNITGSVAQVDGKDISAKAFNELLMEVAGVRVFRQVFDLVLVQNACTAAGIRVEGAEFQKLVEEEKQRTLDKLGEQGVDKDKREQVLAGMLNQRGVTNVEFSMGLQQAAGLRLLAKGRVEAPKPDEINTAFVAQYGPKVQVEVIALKDEKDAAAIREALKTQDFRSIANARQLQWNQFTISSNNNDPAPIKDFRDYGFSAKEKELSPAIPFKGPQGMVYYMVYVDKKIADSGKKLADVQKQVTDSVTAMKEQNWMAQHLNDMRARAAVTIKDPILDRHFKAIMEANRARTSTTQPGGPGATDLPGALPGGAGGPATMPGK
jgi:hypothetical protein